MGKYSTVIEGLPRFKQENPKYQEKVENKKKEIEAELGDLAFSSQDLARAYIMVRGEKEKKEEELKKAELELIAIQELMADRYEFDGVSSITLDNGDVVRLQPEPYAVVSDKEKFWEWCKKEGLERSMSLSWQTTNSLLKEKLLKGEQPPDGVDPFFKNKIVLTKKDKGPIE